MNRETTNNFFEQEMEENRMEEAKESDRKMTFINDRMTWRRFGVVEEICKAYSILDIHSEDRGCPAQRR